MLYAAVTAGEILGDAGLTILTGLTVVFAVLLLLILIIKLFGMLVSALVSEPAAEPVAVPVAAATAPIVGNTAPVSTTPEVQNGIPEETVAAISAAVAAVAPEGTQYAVHSIRKL